MFSLRESFEALQNAGIRADLCSEVGNCHVDDARNALVRKFLQTDCTHLVFLDADVSWHAQDIVRLVQHSGDVVAGVYPKKQDDTEFPVLSPTGEIWANGDGLVEVRGAPTGFMCIARHVLVQLCERHHGRGWRGAGATDDSEPYFPIFERGYFEGQRRSGDYAFCHKAREAGFRVWVDPEMTFGHTGPKTWVGCLGDFWREKAGLEHPLLAPSLARLKERKPADDALFVDLYKAWSNGFSLKPDGLMAAYRLALNARGPILETGSGLTTLVLGIAAQKRGLTVYSLENDLGWFKTTRAALTRHGITPVRLYYAPLREYGAFDWYSVPHGLPHQFGMVMCDGPVRKYGREGLFRLMGDVIEGADILMDDCEAPDMLATLKAHAGDREVHVMGTEGHRKIALALAKAKELAA